MFLLALWHFSNKSNKIALSARSATLPNVLLVPTKIRVFLAPITFITTQLVVLAKANALTATLSSTEHYLPLSSI